MEDSPTPELPKTPASEIEISQMLGSAAIKPVVPEVNYDRFDDLPNRREALRGKDDQYQTVFLAHAIAKKLYRCLCCRGDIPIGSEHVIMSRVQMSYKYTHHHLDFTCTHDIIIPSLTELETAKPQEATATSMNVRARKYRNKQRRSS